MGFCTDDGKVCPRFNCTLKILMFSIDNQPKVVQIFSILILKTIQLMILAVILRR
jgi:hypothetical protein